MKTRSAIRSLPKALLHDHLDGGIRPSTMLELAAEAGYNDLPGSTDADLQTAIVTQATGSGLVDYLAAFSHIQPLLQNTAALRRLAREATEDLQADGIVYAEVRFAPEAHTNGGLTMDAAIDAVLDGLATADFPVGLIITALRHQANSAAVAQAAIRWANRGVVGFDLAGPEDGYPLSDHTLALEIVRPHLPLTIHAGEAAGPHSIAEALDAGAVRIGHGVALARCIEDDAVAPGLLDRVIATRTTLEVCPTSNLQTGIYESMSAHPIEALRRAGVRVTVNTDNRTLGGIDLTHEIDACAAVFGWSTATIEDLTRNAFDAAFNE